MSARRTRKPKRDPRVLLGSMLVPRVLDAPWSAKYLGVSVWTLYDYVNADLIQPLRYPGLTPREGDRPRFRLRRMLFDVRDLDAFVDRQKGGAS
jgi:hypothetical protein